MAHPLAFRDKYFYYPIGNTSAVSLTRDLATDSNLDVLLLGCGDPRNVLYTMYCEPITGKGRTLGFVFHIANSTRPASYSKN